MMTTATHGVPTCRGFAFQVTLPEPLISCAPPSMSRLSARIANECLPCPEVSTEIVISPVPDFLTVNGTGGGVGAFRSCIMASHRADEWTQTSLKTYVFDAGQYGASP